MKHPTETEWIDYLYGETAPEDRNRLRQHLEACPGCQAQTSAWRGTMQNLDAWKLDPAPRRRTFPAWTPAWKWAAAACLLLTTAFAAGRLSSPVPDPAELRAQIAAPLREALERRVEQLATAQARAAAEKALAAASQDLQRQILAHVDQITAETRAETLASTQRQLESLSATLATLRDEDKQAIVAVLQQMELRRVTDLRELRQQLETVAVNTDQSLRLAQRQLVQLAGYSQNSNP